MNAKKNIHRKDAKDATAFASYGASRRRANERNRLRTLRRVKKKTQRALRRAKKKNYTRRARIWYRFALSDFIKPLTTNDTNDTNKTLGSLREEIQLAPREFKTRF